MVKSMSIRQKMQTRKSQMRSKVLSFKTRATSKLRSGRFFSQLRTVRPMQRFRSQR